MLAGHWPEIGFVGCIRISYLESTIFSSELFHQRKRCYWGKWCVMINVVNQLAFTCSKSAVETTILGNNMETDVIDVVLMSLFVNFENISRIVLVFPFLTLNK